MKIIRRFFIYMISFIVVVMASYGYVYWGDLLGEDTPIGYLMGSPQKPDSVEDVEFELVPEEEVQKTDTSVDSQPAVLSEAETPVIVDDSISEQAMQKEDASPEDVQPEVPAPAVDVISQSVSEIEITKESSEPLSISDTWMRARQAFEYRDYEVAIESYQQLISRTQDNFDAYDELGKVYEYYGKDMEAAAAYYEAAIILVRLGKLDRAASFMKPLSLMDATRARALLTLIEAADK